jgi:cytochrome c
MGVLDKIILPPTEAILALLKQLIALVMLIHVPFAGIMIGSLIFSLYYYHKNRNLSLKLAHLIGESPASLIVFGFLPFVTLIFLFGQYFYSAPLKASHYLQALFFPATLGFILVYLYKKRHDVWLGLGALVVLLFTYYFFWRVFDLFMHPEVWPFTKSLFPHIFSFQTLLHAIVFFVFSILLTGAAVLFIYYKFEERKLSGKEDYYTFLKNRAIGWTFVPTLLLPVLILWDAYLMKIWTLNAWSLIMSVISVTMLFILFWVLVHMIKKQHIFHGLSVFILAILSFVAYGLKLNLDETTATREYFTLMKNEVHQKRMAEVAEREALYAKMMKPDLELGKQVFDSKCSSCHAFDRKVFGPPYNEVLPKYVGKEEALRKFVSNPVKINPAYPPMPAQGLTPKQTLSVVAYILQEFEKNAKQGE